MSLEVENRDLVETFRELSSRSCLHLNSAKTKEMMVDFRRAKSSHLPVSVQGQGIEMVQIYQYLGILMDDKLDWPNTDNLYEQGQSYLLFLQRLRSFDMKCNVAVC